MVRLLVIWVIALSMLACNETEETPPGGVAVEENTETVVGNNAGDVLPAVAVAGATVEVPAAVTAAVETARAKAEQAEAEEVAAEEAEEQVAAAARFVAGRDSGGTKSAGVVVETDEQGRVQLNADSFKVNARLGAPHRIIQQVQVEVRGGPLPPQGDGVEVVADQVACSDVARTLTVLAAQIGLTAVNRGHIVTGQVAGAAAVPAPSGVAHDSARVALAGSACTVDADLPRIARLVALAVAGDDQARPAGGPGIEQSAHSVAAHPGTNQQR